VVNVIISITPQLASER